MKHASTKWLPLVVSGLLGSPATQAQVLPTPAPGNPAATQLARLQRPFVPTGAPALRPGARRSEAATRRGILPRPLARAGASLAGRTSARQASTTQSVQQLWVSTTPGYSDLTRDAAGNVFVTGSVLNAAGTNNDYYTAQYDPSGQLVWETRYDGGPALNDDPTDVELDAAGNVYVTGSSGSFSSDSHTYATVKYSPSGQQLWVARYQTFSYGAGLERNGSLAVDAGGNVYVVATTTLPRTPYPPTHYSNITLLKYSSQGAQEWVSRTTDTANNDVATRVLVGPNGAVYVSGASNAGILVRQYNPTSGELAWQATSGASNTTDAVGVDMALDAAGNVVVAGITYLRFGITRTASDYTTLKYSPSGQPLWSARYRGAGGYNLTRAVAVDALGNVFVTGSAYNGRGSSLLTVKYAASNGQQLWTAAYQDPVDASSLGYGNELTTDAAGNVYVTGTTSGNGGRDNASPTFKYDGASGQTVWEIRSSSVGGFKVQLDAAGNVYLGSGRTIAKYAQNSVQSGWEARFTGLGSSAEVAKDVVTDTSGNVYVTGYAYNGRNYDYATVKYNATGQQQWEARYNGPADNEDLPTNVAVDAAGNVYVSGTSYSATESDYATVKYSPTGQQLWVVRYNGPDGGYDLAAKVEVDATGNVYVTGSSDNGSNGSYDYATVKYDTSGQQVWQARYNGPANSYDLATDLVVDATGNAYVTGTTYTATQSDYATLKYDPTGQPVWEARYSGPATGYDEAAKLALADPQQTSVVVTGTSDGGGSTGFDIATAAYNADSGQQQWTYRYNGPQSGDDVVADLVTGRDGYAYVVGTAYSAAGADYATHVLANGQLQWSTLYNGPDNSYDEAKGIAVDATGNAYVTGLSYNSDGTDDYATVKYAFNPNPTTPSLVGRQLWSARYDGAGSYDEAAAITVDARNNVYVTGYSLGSDTGYDFATLQYTQNQDGGLLALPRVASLAAAGRPLAAAPSRHLQQDLSVYPNPASGPAKVRFQPAQEGVAQVRVYNQLGQQVAALYEGPVRVGQVYELSLASEKLPAGLYTCSLLVEGQRESVRLLVTH